MTISSAAAAAIGAAAIPIARLDLDDLIFRTKREKYNAIIDKIKEYNENAGGGRHPIRAVETKRYLYLFNPWSDGTRKFKTATTGTAT